MNDMKKYVLYLIVAAAIVLSWNACQKSGGEVVPGSIDESEPMPVLFGSNLQPSVSTKSAGALDKWRGNDSVYVYGLRRVNNQYVLPTSSDPYYEGDENAYLIRNVKAKTLNVDSQDPMKGSINVYNPANTERDEYFFYRESRYYDFYAYYVDDAIVARSDRNPQPTETGSTISLNVEISGAQDVMLAATDRVADAATAIDPSSLTPIPDLSPNYVYGAYAARRKVKPNLIFDHMLSRFDFKLKKGPTTVTNELEIISLEIYSKSKGTLIIASNDASTPRGIYPDQSQVAVPLAVVGGSTAFPGGDGTYGKPIMVMPGEDEYAVVLKIKQTNYSINDGIVTKQMSIKFADIKPYTAGGVEVKDTKAESGHQYSVTITVHSLEKVEIDVTMTGWDGNHGSFEIDPDELPE